MQVKTMSTTLNNTQKKICEFKLKFTQMCLNSQVSNCIAEVTELQQRTKEKNCVKECCEFRVSWNDIGEEG